jgi:hypothetical protein
MSLKSKLFVLLDSWKEAESYPSDTVFLEGYDAALRSCIKELNNLIAKDGEEGNEDAS